MITRVKIATLKEDFTLYPRQSFDPTYVRYLAEAYHGGSELPPIVIDAKTRTITDGIHRFRMYQREIGDDGEVNVIEQSYKNRKAMWIDAIVRNASHGRRLDRHDMAHIFQRSKELFRLSAAKIASFLGVPVDKFTKEVKQRTATTGKAKTDVPLKGSFKNLAGKHLTRKQVEQMKPFGGYHQVYYVNRVINLIEGERIIDTENERLMTRLRYLQTVIDEFLGTAPCK